jgi:hypothetical protein
MIQIEKRKSHTSYFCLVNMSMKLTHLLFFKNSQIETYFLLKKNKNELLLDDFFLLY